MFNKLSIAFCYINSWNNKEEVKAAIPAVIYPGVGQSLEGYKIGYACSQACVKLI